jgi:hypothetical protein
MRLCLLTSTICIMFSNPIHLWAQGDGESNTITTGQFWYELGLTHAQNGFIYQLDANFTTSNDPTEKLAIANHLAQLGYKASLHYFISPRLKLTAAFGQYKNLDVSVIKQLPSSELRPIIQAQHFVVSRKLTIYNRLRLENRFIKRTGETSYNYTPRLRYMPKVFIALNSNSIRKKTYYLILAEELFANLNAGRLIDFNRVTAGIGYCFSDNIVVELCYANQQFFPAKGPREITNALSLTVSINNIVQMLTE